MQQQPPQQQKVSPIKTNNIDSLLDMGGPPLIQNNAINSGIQGQQLMSGNKNLSNQKPQSMN